MLPKALTYLPTIVRISSYSRRGPCLVPSTYKRKKKIVVWMAVGFEQIERESRGGIVLPLRQFVSKECISLQYSSRKQIIIEEPALINR